jgi:transcriptional regulator with XRE-family HTH domain
MIIIFDTDKGRRKRKKPKTLQEEVGNRIRELRKLKGWTQTEAAAIMKISRQRLGNYELGTREASYEILMELSNVYAVTIDYIIKGQ